jgi:hypothetical protein
MSTPVSSPRRRRLPRLEWLALLLLAALWLVPPARAEVVWENRSLELEAAPGSPEVVGRFRFTNRGPGELRISSVRTTCGCTTAALARQNYAEGEQGEIIATLHDEAVGTTRKALHVFYTVGGGAESSVELTLTMLRREYVRVTPDLVLWRDSQQPLTPQTAMLEVVHDQPIQLVGVTANREGFTAELQTIEPGRKYHLVVTPTVTEGPAYASFTIGSDFPSGQPLSFVVPVRVLKTPTAEPRWRRAWLWLLERVP